MAFERSSSEAPNALSDASAASARRFSSSRSPRIFPNVEYAPSASNAVSEPVLKDRRPVVSDFELRHLSSGFGQRGRWLHAS
jgi:hypothetical protein